MKTTMAVRTLAVLFLTHGAAAWAQQVCDGTLTTPDADFRDAGSGMALHIPTGLVWKRCAEGQTWSGSVCTGAAETFNWRDALVRAEGSTFTGQSDWRLPNIDELRSLVEHGCIHPSINANQFPDTPASDFWSGSLVAGTNYAWGVVFDFGGDYSSFLGGTSYVRLVRAGQGLFSCGVSACPAGDLDADGKSDLVWHNGATGGNAAWLLDVTLDAAIPPVGATGPLPKMPDPTWHLACVADFSGDGKSDLLWRHGLPGETADGSNLVWLMDGSTRLGSRVINPIADLDIQIAGCGDFDGDGKADILWRHGLLGVDKMWLMNVSTDAAVEAVKATTAMRQLTEMTWHVAAVADFDGDGKADILWRDGLPGEAASGGNMVWLMDGATWLGRRAIDPLPDLDWQVAGSGDFNGDGRADLVWRHGVSGLNQLWLLDVAIDLARGVMKAATPLPPQADLTWHIVGSGDYNGDGKADLLWRHGLPGEAVNGANQVWLMNGATRLGVRNINAIPELNWQPAP